MFLQDKGDGVRMRWCHTSGEAEGPVGEWKEELEKFKDSVTDESMIEVVKNKEIGAEVHFSSLPVALNRSTWLGLFGVVHTERR